MMRDADAGAFSAVVFFDLDRLGRDGHRTMVALHDLERADVEVWDYSTGQRVDLDSFETRLPTLLKTEFAQQYREQVSKHTKAAKRRSAEQGYVTGGKLFGYDNVRAVKGQTTRVVNEAEAAVVRTIYERYATGEGLRAIAHALNQRKAPSPRAQQGRPNGWSATSVREVLDRQTYRGTVVFGKTTSASGRLLRRAYPDTRREEGQVPTPEDTWVVREAPELRIIDEYLAARVDARRETWRVHTEAARARGQKPQGPRGKYLLSGGMLLCATCGGRFEGLKQPWTSKAQASGSPPNSGGVYVCATRRRKPGTCTNTMALPIQQTDLGVLEMIEGERLGQRYIEELLAFVDTAVDDTPRLTAELDKLRAECERVATAIATGGDTLTTLVDRLKNYEREIAAVEAQLRQPRPTAPDVERLRAALEQRAARWKRDLRAEPQVARLLLRRLIDPITVYEPELPVPEWAQGHEGLYDDVEADIVPEADTVRWETRGKPGILDGLAEIHHVASPICASWNQLEGWLRAVGGLRLAA